MTFKIRQEEKQKNWKILNESKEEKKKKKDKKENQTSWDEQKTHNNMVDVNKNISKLN